MRKINEVGIVGKDQEQMKWMEEIHQMTTSTKSNCDTMMLENKLSVVSVTHPKEMNLSLIIFRLKERIQLRIVILIYNF